MPYKATVLHRMRVRSTSMMTQSFLLALSWKATLT